MTPAAEILHRCRAAGLTLRRNGDQLAIKPARLCPPALLSQIREHKAALLVLLDPATARLRPDQQPWVYTAHQVVLGEFDGGERSLLESLWIGVRSISHPSCQSATAKLEAMLGRKRKESHR